MSTSTQRLLNMRDVPEGTYSHQVIQQIMLMAWEGLAVGCSLVEEKPLLRKKTNKVGRGGGRKGA